MCAEFLRVGQKFAQRCHNFLPVGRGIAQLPLSLIPLPVQEVRFVDSDGPPRTPGIGEQEAGKLALVSRQCEYRAKGRSP